MNQNQQKHSTAATHNSHKGAEAAAEALRKTVLGFLSDDEVASVSTAETASGLLDGDEYLDLQALDQGVRRARGTAVAMGRVLPRKAVHEATWTKILAQLPVSGAAPPT
jgi:hypothetical protein